MIFSSTGFGFLTVIAGYLMTAMWYCNCGKDQCLKNPATETKEIQFRLKDINGNDIISINAGSQPVPDTIKLIDLRSGFSFPLYAARSVNETIIYSQNYRRAANVIDSLVFRYGTSVPDTLIVYTGMIDGWRGDECPSVKEPGVVKVVLRNQILIETTNDQAIFTLRK